MVFAGVAVDPAAFEVVDVGDAAAREDVFHDDEEELGAEDLERVDAEVLVEEAAGDLAAVLGDGGLGGLAEGAGGVGVGGLVDGVVGGVECVDGWVERSVDGWVECVDGWVERSVDGWVERSVDGWVE